MKKVYIEKLKTDPDPAKIISLPHASRGCPLMVGEFDTEIESYKRSIHLVGGIVNASIVITGAKGIIAHSKPSLLPEHGGSLDLGKMWAQSFLC